MNKERLIELYKQLSDLTAPECKQCRVPLSCCDPMYCQMAKEWAKDKWMIELKQTNHPRLSFMSPTGCIVPPHLRPLCTAHTCDVNSLGFKKNDLEWTERYFKIREEIEELELTL